MTPDAYPAAAQSAEEIARQDDVLGRLAERTRALMDAGMRSRLDLADVDEVSTAIAALTERLLEAASPEPLGIQVGPGGEVRAHGNAVVGLRNPIAPPLHIDRYPDGKALSKFHLGALYEGPPGLVHGGVSALILDQMLGEAAAAGGSPGMTGTLTVKYRRGTPLGDLSAEAWITEVQGYKTTVEGHIKDADGNPTVEAVGLFILPRWAREAMDEASRPTKFE